MKKDTEERFLTCKSCGRGQINARQPLVQCSVCLHAYHLFCLPSGANLSSTNWVCRNHACIICSVMCSPTTPVYHCTLCPNAFCLLHLPVSVEHITPPFDLNSELPFVRYVRCPCRFTTARQTQPHSINPNISTNFEVSSVRAPRFQSFSLEGDTDEEDSVSECSTVHKQDSRSMQETRSRVCSDSPLQFGSKDITKADPVLLNVVRRIMQETNKLQKEVAMELNVSPSTISKWLSGKRKTHGWQKLESKILNWVFEENFKRLHSGQFKREHTTIRNNLTACENRPLHLPYKVSSYPEYNLHIMRLLSHSSLLPPHASSTPPPPTTPPPPPPPTTPTTTTTIKTVAATTTTETAERIELLTDTARLSLTNQPPNAVPFSTPSSVDPQIAYPSTQVLHVSTVAPPTSSYTPLDHPSDSSQFQTLSTLNSPEATTNYATLLTNNFQDNLSYEL